MKPNLKRIGLFLLAGTALVCAVSPAQAADKKPNIILIVSEPLGLAVKRAGCLPRVGPRLHDQAAKNEVVGDQ